MLPFSVAVSAEFSVEPTNRSRFVLFAEATTGGNRKDDIVEGEATAVADSVLQRIAGGNRSAMEECLELYGGLVWKIVSSRCRNRGDAEDVVQEIFLDLWRSADRFDPQVASEATFVAMLARRRVIDQNRRRQRSMEMTPLLDRPGWEPESPPEPHRLEVDDEASRAREMMKELRSDERRVIELAIDEGLSQSEIAERTEMPLGTVKSNARRGLLRLRRLLTGGTLLETGVRE